MNICVVFAAEDVMSEVADYIPNQKQSPIVELLTLAGPTVAQAVSYTVMQFIDTWMLSRLGTEAPTAAANAGMIAFAFISFGFGIMLIVNTLVSQAYGRNQRSECGTYLWQGFWVGAAYAILILPMIAFAPALFRAFDHSPGLVKLEASYMQIVLLATAFKMFGTAGGQFLLATNRPRMVFAAAFTGVSVNAVLAYAVVLGHWGFARHGVVGAAWAQNAGVVTEMSLTLAFAFLNERIEFNALDWRLRFEKAVTLVKIGTGAGLQIVADIVAWSLFLVWVIHKLGDNAMAANQFMFRYMVISFMPAYGISQAVTALVGRYIGMRQFDTAMQRANLGFSVTAVYMTTCGLMMGLFRYPLIHVFTVDPEVARLGATLLIFAGVYQLFDAMYMVYNGALRGAGDTFIPALVTAILCWGVTVGGGYFIVTHFPQLGIAGPWMACMTYGILLGLFCLTRFRRGSWKAIHLENGDPSNIPDDSTKLSVVSDSLSAVNDGQQQLTADN